MRRIAFLLVLAVFVSTLAVGQNVRRLDPLDNPVPLKNWPVSFEPVFEPPTEDPFMVAPEAVPSSASHFITLVPCRVLDTRNAVGPYGGPGFYAGEVRSLDVDDGPCAGIPATATAYSVNITITNPSAGGWITAWPTGAARPFVSSLNYLASQTVANAAIVPAGTAGAIDLYSVAATHLIIDINGYFAEGIVTSLTAGTGLSGGGTGAVTLGIADGGVDTNQLASLAVTDAKLAMITTAGKVANSATTATSANVANTIVARDGAGGFAAGALTLSGRVDQTSVDGLVARGTLDSGTIPATGAGLRLMWYPRKAAFRAGRAGGAEWDDASTGHYSAAMGWSTTASGTASTAIGYYTTASGYASTAMGWSTTASGQASTAMGYYASTTDSGGTPRYGTFVWGDSSTGALVRPTANNQFVARAAGGVTFYSNYLMSTGVSLAAGGGSWASVSDRASKTGFDAVDGEAILNRLADLPVESWRYRDDLSGRRYIGPVAQDFHAAFGLGDDKTIATLDVDGVTLAAVKALEARTMDLQSENAFLRQQLERQGEAHMELQRRVEKLEIESR